MRTLLLEAFIPSQSLVEVLSSVTVWMINRFSSSILDFDTPLFLLFNAHPNYHDPHTFGCVCFVH